MSVLLWFKKDFFSRIRSNTVLKMQRDSVKAQAQDAERLSQGPFTFPFVVICSCINTED
ncbi:hypothetical protein ACS0TY_035531 [Phlomoides rotata]